MVNHRLYSKRRRNGVIFNKQPNSVHPETIAHDIANFDQGSMAKQVDPTPLIEALELLDQGISIMDADFKLIYCNNRVARMLDLPARMVTPGTSLETIFHYNAERGEYGPGSPEDIVLARMAMLRRHEAHKFERTRPDGTIIEITGKPLEDGGFITIYSDVTALKQAESSLREAKENLEERVKERTAKLRENKRELAHQKALLEATLEHVSQGISVFDKDLSLVLYNDHFLKMLGFPTRFGKIGKSMRDFFEYNARRGDYGEGDIDKMVEERMELARHPEPHTFTRNLGNDRTIEVCGNPMPQLTGGFVTTYSDVTAMVRAQEEAVAAKEEAEEALRQLRETQQSLVQAEKMAALGQLVAGVAHEINTPLGVGLTSMTHFQHKLAQLDHAFKAGQLKRSQMANFITAAHEATELAVSNLKRAAGLVDGFKKIAVDQTTEKRRIFNVHDYTRDVVSSLQAKINYKGAKVTLTCPETLELDSYPGAYSQVISNIVLNAVEHAFNNHQPKTIALTVKATDDILQVTVHDNGRGIPKDDLPKIFDPFFTTGRGRGRSGLGLNHVYNILQTRLRGNITCTSEPGQGTSFTITLPRQVPEEDVLQAIAE